VLGEEAAGEIGVFGGKPHLAVMLEAKGGGDVVEVRHGTNVDPGLRHRDRDIGKTEAELVDEDDFAIRVRDHLANQIFAGDTEMHRAERKLRGDFRRRKVGDFHAVEAGDGAAIVAGTARLDEFEAGTGEKTLPVLLQAPLRGHGEDQRRAHAGAPNAESSSIDAAKPTAGMGSRAPSRVNNPS